MPSSNHTRSRQSKASSSLLEYRPKSIASTANAKRKDHIAEASQAILSGRRAEAWLAQWDRGVKATRMHVLEAFVALHQESNSSTMESDLGDAAPLLFTRITSWLRLTYKALRTRHREAVDSSAPDPSTSPEPGCRSQSVGPEEKETEREKRCEKSVSRSSGKPTVTLSSCLPGDVRSPLPGRPPPGRPTPLLLLVQSIIIFVRGASYMTQFVEAGLAPTLTDCLECGTQAHSLTLGVVDTPNLHQLLTLEERRHLVLLLLYISNAGRVYREMICEEGGLIAIFHALQREKAEEVCLMLTELFIQLGQGNPRIAPLIHCGLVRLILCHCRRRGVGSRLHETDTPIPDAEREIGRRLATYTGLERTVSDHVAFHAARALHYLQITAEEHYFAQCQSGRGLQGVQMSVDMVPIVGLKLNAAPSTAAAVEASGGEDPLIAELTFPEFLDALMYLTLHDNTRFRVEGSELLALAAKNIQLTRHILSRCFEVLDDDILNITDEDDIDRISRRQRLQLSCGRAAVQIILSKPMTDERKSLIIKFVALHGAHLSILKYLRLSDSGDAAAVHDCCKALQIIARASHAQQRAELQQKQLSTSSSPLLQMGQIIHDAIGDSLYQVLLHEELTEDESFVVLRAAKSTKLLARKSAMVENNVPTGPSRDAVTDPAGERQPPLSSSA